MVGSPLDEGPPLLDGPPLDEPPLDEPPLEPSDPVAFEQAADATTKLKREASAKSRGLISHHTLRAALVFLDLNGIEIRDPAGRLYDAMIGLAEHTLDNEALADLLRYLT